MNATSRQLKNQIKLRRDIRPRLARRVQDQFVSQLYTDTLGQIGRQIRHRGSFAIEARVLAELSGWAT